MKAEIIVDGKKYITQPGVSVLHFCRSIGIDIPSLCYHDDLPACGNCGVCCIQINGNRIVRACSTPVEDGLEIVTKSRTIINARRQAVEIILSNHPNNCLECIKNGYCELQALARRLNIRKIPYTQIKRTNLEKDMSSPSIVLNPAYCIQCGRCTEVCNNVQDVHALQVSNRGFLSFVGPTLGRKLDDSECVKCGQCSAHCPVAAIYEHEHIDDLIDAINDKDKIVVAQEAPAVRVALGEIFGLPVGTNVVEKMYTALRDLGVDYVFDTNFAADLTIMEEASEFVKIFKSSNPEFPLITTCCPSWVDYLEKFYADLIPHFSSAKSPHQMMGTVLKTYWAKKMNIDPKKIFLVSVMPCTSKKYEINRNKDMYSSGVKDVDLTITTRELGRLLKESGIDLPSLEESESDNPLGEYSGAGTIFGASGGVMEAALRTAYFMITNNELPNPNVELVRGIKGIKSGEIEIAGSKIRIAVASGLANVKSVLNEIREAKKNGEEVPYHFMEVMACRGGCVGGGGQPYPSTNRNRVIRAKGLYKEDNDKKIRESHNNPFIKKLYDDFLEKPLSHKAHKLLHTSYKDRSML